MDTQKYRDMAYGNPTGQHWISILSRPDIWANWLHKVENLTQNPNYYNVPKEYARRIVTMAIWHLGYAQNIHNNKIALRCARRLRMPPDRGVGDGKPIYGGLYDRSAYRIPWEFIELDNFLEYHVRPLM